MIVIITGLKHKPEEFLKRITISSFRYFLSKLIWMRLPIVTIKINAYKILRNLFVSPESLVLGSNIPVLIPSGRLDSTFYNAIAIFLISVRCT